MHVLPPVKPADGKAGTNSLFSIETAQAQDAGLGARAQARYRFAFFPGASSTLCCWPRVRAPGGLASLLRLVEGDSCAFDLQGTRARQG